MEIAQSISESFNYFLHYKELSEKTLRDDYKNQDSVYYREAYVYEKEKAGEVELSSEFNEKIIGVHECYSPQGNEWEVVIAGNLTFEKFLLNYRKQLEKDISQHRGILLKTISDVYFDLSSPVNKEELYIRILNASLKILKRLDENNWVHEELISKSIQQIASFSISLFSQLYFNITAEKNFHDFLQRMNGLNPTRFALINFHSVKIMELYNFLIESKFISDKTKFIQLRQFFRGENPKPKINWEKDERHLKYFIKQYCDSGKVINRNGQPYDTCRRVFLLHGNPLNLNWSRNVRLSATEEKDEIDRLIHNLP